MDILSLPDDILESVLESVPDFCTLRSVILASKRFHDAYIEHPNSINMRIASNMIGPGLPEVIRLVRHPAHMPKARKLRKSRYYDEDDSATEDDSEDDLVKAFIDVEWSSETTDGPKLTNTEMKELTHHARTVQKLEGLFSFR